MGKHGQCPSRREPGYQQLYDPVANSLALSAVVALIPIVVQFVLLAGILLAAQWASALIIDVLIYMMPFGLP
jgi:lactate permease